MRENRREPRKRTKEWGKIVLDDEHTVYNCTITDVSTHGACLRVGAATVPDRFFLFRKADQTLREATVKSRRFQTVGVELTPPLNLAHERSQRLLAAIVARNAMATSVHMIETPRRSGGRPLFHTALGAAERA